MKIIDNLTASAIDQAFRKVPRPVYVVIRHGNVKRCFSRNTALRNLAKFMTRKVFHNAGRPIEYAPVREMRPEGEVWVTQGPTAEFKNAQRRCVRRLRRILDKKRAYQKWKEKLNTLTDQYHEHLKQKPY